MELFSAAVVYNLFFAGVNPVGPLGGVCKNFFFSGVCKE